MEVERKGRDETMIRMIDDDEMDQRGNYDDNCDGLNSPAAYVVIYNDLLMKMMDIITMIMIVWNY